MCGRQFDPIRRQVLEGIAGGLPVAAKWPMILPARVGSLLHEAKYLMHLDDFALHAGDLIDADQSAPCHQEAVAAA